MPTLRVEIGPRYIKEASAAADAGTHKSSNPLIYADVIEKGLQLRVQSSSVSWILKYNGKTKSLGNLTVISNAKVARDLARETRNLMRENIDSATFLNRKKIGETNEDAIAASVKKSAVLAGQWTWSALVSEYTDNYLSKPKMRNGALQPPSAQSAKNARISLSIVEANFLKDKLLAELTPADLEHVRDECAKADKRTASRAFVMNAKAAMSFARKRYAGKSGLSDSTRWWLEVQVLDETAVAPRTRTPSLYDLARVLHIAEKYRSNEEGGKRTTETLICAFWFIALTAQRVDAALSLKKENVLPHPDADMKNAGWKVAYWQPENMKSRRLHALPLPPKLALLLDRAGLCSTRKDSEYVFPATALYDGKPDTHVNRNSPKNLMARFREKGLLEDIPHFTPHDIRRTFATWCSDNLIVDGAASAVLDHQLEGGAGIRSADVTRQVYDRSQRLNLKALAMEKWVDALLSTYENICNAVLPIEEPDVCEEMVLYDHATLKKTDLSAGVPYLDTISWWTILEKENAKKTKKIRLLKAI